jgi:DnaJ-class molecular chaperone
VFQFVGVCSDNLEFEQAGDVQITLQLDENDEAGKIFRRTLGNQQHLETVVTFSLSESLMGCVVQLNQHPGYDEGLFVHLPPSFHGDTYCLKGFGMPTKGSLGSHGDLYIKVHVVVSVAERKLYITKGREALVEQFHNKIRPMNCDADVVQMEAELVHV